jgi:uncharacterized protein YgbK (DUF1537 family)
MDESDLIVHLSRQTDRRVTLVDALVLDRGVEASMESVLEAADGDIVLFDVLSESHQAVIGAVLVELQNREKKPLFVAGSSAIESALTQAWQASGQLPDVEEAPQPALCVAPIIAVSGSCSPVTNRQIDWAVAHGFVDVELDVATLGGFSQPESALSAVANRIVKEHDAGRSVIVHPSRGASDGWLTDRIIDRKAASSLGQMLGRILDLVLQARRVRRIAVAGGDTAGDVARALGIEALQMVAPLAPGAPLCRARSPRQCVDGVELTLKGGQVGGVNFFGMVQSASDWTGNQVSR